jgi:putative membrane protein insertion efficiency factor
MRPDRGPLHRGEQMKDPQPSFAVRLVYGFYKRILSPVLHAFSPSQCLYLPTCSEYAYVALVRFGVMRGSWLALRRIGRCHPFAKGGLDPVPLGASESVAAPISTDHLS